MLAPLRGAKNWQLCGALFRAVWAKLGRKRLLWERMRALFYDYGLDSMRALFEARLYGVDKPRPLLTMDTSSLPLLSLTGLLTNATLPRRQGRRMPN